MPLVVATLTKELEAAFLSDPSDAQLSANKMATAYDNYCKAALAGGIPPLFTGSEQKKLMGILLGAIQSKAGDPSQFANAWMSGVQSYWMSPPITFTAPPIIGMVTAIAGLGAIVGAISGIIANSKNTASSAAQGIASALDAATKTILVTFTAPPPPTGPPPPATVI